MGTLIPLFTRLKSRRDRTSTRHPSPLESLVSRIIPDAWCDPQVVIGHCAWCAKSVTYGDRAHEGTHLVHYSCLRKRLQAHLWTAVRCGMFETLVPLIATHPQFQVASLLGPLHEDGTTPAKAALVLHSLRLKLGSNANSVIIADAKRQLHGYLAA